jgi:hypothetical protein
VGYPGRGGRPPGGRGRAVEAGAIDAEMEWGSTDLIRQRIQHVAAAAHPASSDGSVAGGQRIAVRDSDRTRQRPPVVRGVLG